MQFEKNEPGKKVYVWTRGGGKVNQQEAAVISSQGEMGTCNLFDHERPAASAPRTSCMSQFLPSARVEDAAGPGAFRL